MSQGTSAQAYNDLEGRGVLRTRRAEVQQAFSRFGPGTAAEVLHKAALDANRNLARARVTELANDGQLVECRARKCTITGRRAIVWRVLDRNEQPIKRTRPTLVALDAADIDTAADVLGGRIGVTNSRIDQLLTKILNAAKRETQSELRA